MPITSEQRVARRGHLGASDAPAIFNEDPFNNVWGIWAEKTGKLKHELIETDPNDVKNIGTLFEPVVMQWASGILGEIELDVEVKKNLGFPMVVHLDGQLIENSDIVEAKTSGMKGPLHEHWGEEYTDDIPRRVIIQVAAQAMCTGASVAHIPTFLGGRGFEMFEVCLDDPEVFQMITDKLGHFWNENVLKDIPPDDSQPTMDVIKRIIRTPKEIVKIYSADVDEWQHCNAEKLKYKKLAETALAKVLAQLGTAEGGECQAGLVTYLEQTRKAYTVKESTFPVARFKKRK